MKKLHRRTVLRGLLGGGLVTIGLPFLEAFNRRASAAPDSFPKRFGMFYWGNGMLPEFWVPKSTGTTYELSPTLAPLAKHKPKISVVTGMKVPIVNAVPHFSGPIGFFSGSPPLAGDNEAFAAPTIDQVIANAIGGDSRFRSLEVGVAPDAVGLSYNGPHSLNPAESSPAALFQRVFGPEFVMPGGEAKPNPTLALRKSVLDAVTDDAKSLQGILGATDKTRLEQHLDGVRALEKRIQKLQESPPKLDACKLPMEPKPEYPSVDGRPPLSEISRVMSDLIAMSLACDQTRVFSLWFSQPVTNVLFQGAPAGHHQLTHDEASPQPEVAKILLQIMTELAYFLDALDAVPEGEGTLLDHCGILATSDVSYGRQHLLDDYPIVIAGSANGALKTGLHYRSPANENTSKVTLTLARAMGMTLDSFGTAEAKATDGLSAIEV
jgi:hypothetical protein